MKSRKFWNGKAANNWQKKEKKEKKYADRTKKVLETIKSLNLPCDSNILELGQGTGDVISRLKGNKVCVDISEELNNVARSKGLDVITSDCEEVVFDIEKFDLIIAVGLLQYVEDPFDFLLRKVYYWLKPGGYLLLVQRNVVGRGKLKFLPYLLGFPYEISKLFKVRKNIWTFNRLRKLVVSSGLRVRSVEIIGRNKEYVEIVGVKR